MGMSTEKPHNGRKKESQFAIFAQSSGRGKRFAQTKKAHAKTYFFQKNLCAAKGISKRRCRQARLEEEEGILKIFFDSSSSSPYAGREGRG